MNKTLILIAASVCFIAVACKKKSEVNPTSQTPETPKTISDTIKKLQGAWVCRDENRVQRAQTSAIEPGMDTVVDLTTTVTVYIKNDSMVSACCMGYNQNFVYGQLGGWEAYGGFNPYTQVLAWSGYTGNAYTHKSWYINYYYKEDSIEFYEAFYALYTSYELFVRGKRK